VQVGHLNVSIHLDGPAKSQEVSVESRGDWGTFFDAAKKLSRPPAGGTALKENRWLATFCDSINVDRSFVHSLDTLLDDRWRFS
ncbi:MAG: hypothetical protein AB1547_03880, partial [Thermodesulfobacteriota bacterium]